MTCARILLLLALSAACATTPKRDEGSASAPTGPTAPAPEGARGDTPARPAGADPYARADVAAIREQARAQLKAQYEASWKSWTGGGPLDVGATYAGRDDLFSPASVKVVRAAREAASGDSARALRALELYLSGEVLARQTASVADELARAQASATVKLGDESIPWRDLDRQLAGEPSATGRAQIYAAEEPVLATLNPIVEKKLKATESVARDLGYASYAALAAELRGAGLEALAALADGVLADTDAVYAREMEKLAQQHLALPLAKVLRSDVPRLLTALRADAVLAPAKMLEATKGVFRGLGVDVAAQQGLTLHTTVVPKKNPRAVCLPVDVPEDVRVSAVPSSSPDEWRAVLHELAHAEHYLHVSRPEWEFQQLGNVTVIEATSALVDGIVDQPAWLEGGGVPADRRDALARTAALRRLITTRRSAARVLFEAQWHAGRITGAPSEAWRKIQSRAHGFELTPDDGKRFLVDHDEFLQSADYLRATLLAAQLELHLAKEFGAKWWTSAAAGTFLKSLWAEGTRASPDEVARKLGAQGVETGAFVRALEARLGK